METSTSSLCSPSPIVPNSWINSWNWCDAWNLCGYAVTPVASKLDTAFNLFSKYWVGSRISSSAAVLEDAGFVAAIAALAASFSAFFFAASF